MRNERVRAEEARRPKPMERLNVDWTPITQGMKCCANEATTDIYSDLQKADGEAS